MSFGTNDGQAQSEPVAALPRVREDPRYLRFRLLLDGVAVSPLLTLIEIDWPCMVHEHPLDLEPAVLDLPNVSESAISAATTVASATVALGGGAYYPASESAITVERASLPTARRIRSPTA